MLFLCDIRDRLTLVALTEREYYEVMEASAAAGLVSGAIYDSLLGCCAIKAKAEAIYTWNVKHFQLLPAAIARRVKTPERR